MIIYRTIQIKCVSFQEIVVASCNILFDFFLRRRILSGSTT